MHWDIFISHATEDKEQVVTPLAENLTARGFRVWLDTAELLIGDSLRAKIDEGLAGSRFGIVVISPAFMAKNWPQKELDGLIQREIDGRKVVLPVWHKVSRNDVSAYSLILASKLAGTTAKGIDALASEISKAIGQDDRAAPSAPVPNRIQVEFSFQRGAERPDEHRYQLRVEIVLNAPPAIDDLRFEFRWPQRVAVIASHGLQRTGELRVGRRDYVEYAIEARRRIFPGQRLCLIGVDSVFMYSVDWESYRCISCGDMLLSWRLMLPTGMPMEGEVNLQKLNEF